MPTKTRTPPPSIQTSGVQHFVNISRAPPAKPVRYWKLDIMELILTYSSGRSRLNLSLSNSIAATADVLTEFWGTVSVTRPDEGFSVESLERSLSDVRKNQCKGIKLMISRFGDRREITVREVESISSSLLSCPIVALQLCRSL